MNQVTTYTVRSKNTRTVWRFKYYLNGALNEFSILEGLLTERQLEWFFRSGNFPYYEDQMKLWQVKLRGNFEIVVGESDLTFEALYEMYNYKVKRVSAEKAFDKLKEADVIKCFLAIKGYDTYLQKRGVAKAHLSTFINQRYFDDDWNKA